MSHDAQLAAQDVIRKRFVGVPDPIRCLTIAQTCERIGIARSTFAQLRKAGKGPRREIRIYGSPRFRETDLAEWLDGFYLKTTEEDKG